MVRRNGKKRGVAPVGSWLGGVIMVQDNSWWAWSIAEAWQFLIHVPFLGIITLVLVACYSIGLCLALFVAMMKSKT